MKKIRTPLYVIGSLLAPWVALAHNGVDDGDEVVSTPHPEQRMYVLAGVGVVVALLVGFMWYSRMKNRPTGDTKNNNEGTPSSSL